MGIFDNFKAIFTASSPQQPNTNTNNSVEQQPTTHKKIMIVEDEKVLADALEIKFQHEGFKVFKAENGQVGLDMIKQNKPDIVLLDLMMPVMDGKTMLRRLRETPDFKYLPVVVLTNAGEVDNIKETKQYDNASAFLIKSNINPEDVVKVVKDLLRM
jgi:DNA-binding response OmpR family regulator